MKIAHAATTFTPDGHGISPIALTASAVELPIDHQIRNAIRSSQGGRQIALG